MRRQERTALCLRDVKDRLDGRNGLIRHVLDRRAGAAYEPADDAEASAAELNVLAAELDRVVGLTEQKLDRALTALDQMRATLSQPRASLAR